MQHIAGVGSLAWVGVLVGGACILSVGGVEACAWAVDTALLA
jgi:hypothetical protein